MNLYARRLFLAQFIVCLYVVAGDNKSRNPEHLGTSCHFNKDIESEKFDLFSVQDNPQKMLHAAILNNSVRGIKHAIHSGADINLGLGNQPPLLLAVIMEQECAARELLEQGANPDVWYLNKPLVFYILKKNNYQFAKIYLSYGLELSDTERTEAVNTILFQNPYRLDQTTIDVLKMLKYNIKNNFKSSNLLQNKWYQLLARQYMGTDRGNNVGHAGLPDRNEVALFLANGANPNQLFYTETGVVLTPLLLIIDNYLGLENKTHYRQSVNELVNILVKAGADVNLKAACLPNLKEACPLSYLLIRDDSNCLIDILVAHKAKIGLALQLFLRADGSANKIFGFWQRCGYWDLLSWTIENNSPAGVQLLLRAGLRPDEIALKLAIRLGRGEILDILLGNR